MKQCYIDFANVLKSLSTALNDINADTENPQIKLLIMKLVGDMNINSPEVLENVSWITFAINNDDPTLSKLTAEIAGVGKPEVAAE
jgi:hypothetical protein